jgi:pimeloyl-ACP methyl ester carboxylesterase
MSAHGPKWLYLHGFASGPGSTKGVALARHFAARGVELERLDGRRPSLERLRLSAILEEVRRAIGGAADRAVVFGSSLGGLAAARVAEEDARVCALVLLAPGFRIAERFRTRMGEAAFSRWRESGWLETLDYTTNHPARVDFGFIEDAARIDARNDGSPDVRVPTLVVHGRQDDTCDIDLSRAWAAGKRHVRVVEVDDGHELTQSLPVIIRESESFLAPFLGVETA